VILWIESQNVAVIALIVFGLCYAIAALIFVAIVFVSRRPIASDLKATTPVMLTPLSVIAGLLIAFLASRVWSNVDRANSYVAQEASAISQVVLLTDALPDDPRKAVRDGLRTYLQFIKAEDWPAMLMGRASFQQLPPGLTDAAAALLSFAPSQPGQHVVQRRAVVALEQALEARRSRHRAAWIYNPNGYVSGTPSLACCGPSGATALVSSNQTNASNCRGSEASK
jgi:hypothetical protein